jgi:hypothetical protein
MATESSGQPPPAPVGSPTPSGPNASRYEWRAYRHQERDSYRAQRNAHLGPLASTLGGVEHPCRYHHRTPSSGHCPTASGRGSAGRREDERAPAASRHDASAAAASPDHQVANDRNRLRLRCRYVRGAAPTGSALGAAYEGNWRGRDWDDPSVDIAKDADHWFKRWSRKYLRRP